MSQNVKVERTLEFRHKGGGSVVSTIDVDNFANVLLWRPETDDTGYISIGDGTKDFDVQICLNGATKYALFDVGNSLFTLEDVDLKLGDNDEAQFGDATGGDVSVVWNGTKLNVIPATDDTGYIAIGNGTKDLDVQICLSTAAKYVLFDVGNVYLTLEDVDLRLGDNDMIQFGDALAGGDVTLKWDATNLVMLPTANDTGYFKIGDGSTDFDVWVTLGNATKYVLFDVGNDYLTLSNVNLNVPNILTSASSTAGIIYMVAATRAVCVS